MTKSRPLVCFLTDFGLSDAYVGSMKGVLISLVPDVRIVDLTNSVPPQNIQHAAFQLMSSARFFPKETFFVCVVDPGVGSERKIIYAEAGERRFIAPDNGLLSWLFRQEKPTLVTDVSKGASASTSKISKTFHGRDIMARVVGHLLQGEPVRSFGSQVHDWKTLPFPEVKKVGSKWAGEVIAIDGFGNLITNFPTEEIEPLSARSKIWIEFGEPETTIRGMADSYTAVEKGRLLAIGGSGGFIEIALRDGNAAEKTGLHEGSPVSINFFV